MKESLIYSVLEWEEPRAEPVFAAREKKENNCNRWFVDVFHPTNNCGTLETQGIGAEIYWKNVRKVASTVPKM